jgi:hypothetical protein
MINQPWPINRERVRLMLSILSALIIGALTISVAQAHENRVVGKYKLTVGWLDEPALLNQLNSLDFRVVVSDTQKPVEGLGKTLHAEVVFGASSMPLVLSPRFGQPGAYSASLIPTRSGSYFFHFTGTIEGIPIDEKFESGPGRFTDVGDTAALQFPLKLPAPAEAAAQLKAAQDSAVGAQATAYFGIALGLLGLAVGAIAFMRPR